MVAEQEFRADWGDSIRVELCDGVALVGVLNSGESRADPEAYRLWVSVEPETMVQLAKAILKEYWL